MKKIIAVLLLLATLCVAFCACSKDNTPNGMINAATENAKFFLYVPDNWVSQANGGVSGATSPGNEGCNVTVTAYLPEKGFTAQSYWEEKCMPEYQVTFQEIVPDDTLTKDTTLGGFNAKQFVFSAKLGGNSYRFLQIIAVTNDLVYTLTYTGSAEHFATYLEDVETIRANFLFK